MRWGQVCLRIMLWSLGMTATAGVALIFAAENEILLRLLGTTAAATFAAGLLWPLTRLADWESGRLAALFGMATVLFEFTLVVVLLWGELLFRHTDFRFEDKLWQTFGYVFLTSVPAFLSLLFWVSSSGWLAARVGVATSGLTFLSLMASVFEQQGAYYVGEPHWLVSAGCTALFGYLAAFSLAGFSHTRPWRWAGVAAGIVGWSLGTISAFRHTGSQFGEVAFTIATSIAVVVAYANLCMQPKLSAAYEVFRMGSIAAAVATALVVDYLAIRLIVEPFFPGGEFVLMLERIASALGIITACGTIAILVLALVHRSKSPRELVAPRWVELEITCPACGLRQNVPLGESACAQCRLLFCIRIGQPTR